MNASPSSRVTLADFRAMQTLLLDTRQQLEDSRDQERKAREELRERPVLPDPASFPPPPPRGSAAEATTAATQDATTDAAGVSKTYPTELNPFGPAAGRVSVDVQTDPSALELELHDELRRMRDTLHRTREELQASRDELQASHDELRDTNVRRVAACVGPPLLPSTLLLPSTPPLRRPFGTLPSPWCTRGRSRGVSCSIA